MATLFFDTSALARRYTPNEPDRARVIALCSRRAGHSVFLSRITAVEMASSFSRLVREGVFSTAVRERQWRQFGTHCRTRYELVAPDEAVYRQAEQLLFRHTLRAYDAVQLATALRVARMFAGSNVDFRFCTADRAQGAAASAEGLVVEMIG